MSNGGQQSQNKANGAMRISDSVYGRLVFSQDYASECAKRSLPKDAQSAILSLNTVCPYYTMFPLDFPLWRLTKADKNDWVLDPFCGRGTTIFAARLLGLGCVGIDSNPIAAAIAAAKLAYTISDAIVETARERIDRATKQSRSKGPVVLMDTGNYESFWKGSPDWREETFHKISSTYEYDRGFCYDNQVPPITEKAISEDVVRDVLRHQERSSRWRLSPLSRVTCIVQ